MNIVTREFLREINQRCNHQSVSTNRDMNHSDSSSFSENCANESSVNEQLMNIPDIDSSMTSSYVTPHSDEDLEILGNLQKNKSEILYTVVELPIPNVRTKSNEATEGNENKEANNMASPERETQKSPMKGYKKKTFRGLNPIRVPVRSNTRMEDDLMFDEKDDFLSNLIRLKKDVKNRINNVITFERRTNNEIGHDNVKYLKRNNSEKKLTKSQRNIKTLFTKNNYLNANINNSTTIIKDHSIKEVPRKASINDIQPNGLDSSQLNLEVQESFAIHKNLKSIANLHLNINQNPELSPNIPRNRNRKNKIVEPGNLIQKILMNKHKTFDFKRETNEPASLIETTQINMDNCKIEKVSFEKFQNSVLLTLYIFVNENAVDIYVDKYMSLNQMINNVVPLIYDRFKELLLHPLNTNIYEVRPPDSFLEGQPDKLMEAIKDTQQIIQVMNSLELDEKIELYLLHNVEKLEMLKVRQERYEDYQKKIDNIKSILSIDSHSTHILVPISSIDIGVKSTIVKMEKSNVVKDIFTYFKKKIRNFNKNDFSFTQERITLYSNIDGTPIEFDEVPLPLTTQLKDVSDSIIIMNKKIYKDDMLFDDKLSYLNQSKLNIIKSYDTSIISNQRQMSHPLEYKSISSAKFYEVFTVKRIHQKSRVPFTLGVDHQYLYIIDNSNDTLIKPSFPITHITEYRLLGSEYLHLVIDDDGKKHVYILESDKIVQIHNKINYILSNMYQ